jgi:TrmH family RNA methyltransferase
MAEYLSSPQNSRIKRVAKLRKRRNRLAEGVTIVEGIEELQRAASAPGGFTEIYTMERLVSPAGQDLINAAEAKGAPVFDVSPELFHKIAIRENADGIVAIAPSPVVSLGELELSDSPLILVAEAIEKPGNLGAMLRTGDAAGVDAVILCDPTTDATNPNVVRASLGCLFTVPVAEATLADTTEFLGSNGIIPFITTPAATQAHYEADLTGPTALVVGSEHDGVSSDWIEGAHEKLLIPMAGDADSLNTAMSAGIVLYEAVRQRSL